jgi:hypothetical protein
MGYNTEIAYVFHRCKFTPFSLNFDKENMKRGLCIIA